MDLDFAFVSCAWKSPEGRVHEGWCKEDREPFGFFYLICSFFLLGEGSCKDRTAGWLLLNLVYWEARLLIDIDWIGLTHIISAKKFEHQETLATCIVHGSCWFWPVSPCAPHGTMWEMVQCCGPFAFMQCSSSFIKWSRQSQLQHMLSYTGIL